jgi:hypothetical protein
VPLPGDRDGLYGGTDNNAEVDRDKMINFLGANPSQAGAFVDALNTDTTMYWSGGRRLVVADIPMYLRELTPALLRLDTRITNHGFDGAHPTIVQSVLQAGTAVLLDAHGVPRIRGLSGSPLTAPNALNGEPKLVGTAWPGYHPGGLARVEPTTTAITNFVLVDVVTGQPFNRPAGTIGTIGTNDTPHTEPIAVPGPASATSAPPTSGHTLLDDIDGTYQVHTLSWICSGIDEIKLGYQGTVTITHQGNSLTYGGSNGSTGTLNPDGSFSVRGGDDVRSGNFVNDGGRILIHGQEDLSTCHGTFDAAKQ